MVKPYPKEIILMILLIAFAIGEPQKALAAWDTKKKVTIMCYMNGDNDLAGEVLYAVDMMETVGSSDDIDILALVDGRPGANDGYGHQWEKTKLLYITKDDDIGTIHSPVIEEMGEQNLGDPRSLEKFIQTGLKYRSEQYIFITFAHGRGIIDTKSLEYRNDSKSLFLSPDETGGRAMTHQEFRRAIKNGLSGERFQLMVFFSCLTNMVEIGYEFRDITRYMIGSEDEIRIVNDPPGTFQIRGIKLERLIGKLRSNPETPAFELGKVTIDSFIEQYEKDIVIQKEGGQKNLGKYSAGLSFVDCQKYGKIAKSLDMLAKQLIEDLGNEVSGKNVLKNLQSALLDSQKYASFLNLEYHDLQDFLENLSDHSGDDRIKALSKDSLDILKNELILYERHTEDSHSNGVSIFLPSFLVPENIYSSHRGMYKNSRFSKDTSWDEMIDTYRTKMLARYAEIMIDACEKAFLKSDLEALERLRSRIPWALCRDVLKGNYTSTQRYLDFLKREELDSIPRHSLLNLHEALKISDKNRGISHDLLKRVEALIRSGRNNSPGGIGRGLIRNQNSALMSGNQSEKRMSKNPKHVEDINMVLE